MGFNWREVIGCINAFTSPRAAQDFMLNKIGNKDPQLSDVLRQMISSNKNPAEVLTTYAASGKITLQQLAQIKNYYNLARRMGMKHQIPNEEWQKAEQAIRVGMKKTHRTNMTGF